MLHLVLAVSVQCHSSNVKVSLKLLFDAECPTGLLLIHQTLRQYFDVSLSVFSLVETVHQASFS